MKVNNFSVFFNGPYANNFENIYKGIIVVVDTSNCGSSAYMHFAIRNCKGLKRSRRKNTIFKTRNEKLNKIVFNDAELSITCDFENLPTNKCTKTIIFSEDCYKEIRENLPKYMIDNGAHFTFSEYENKVVLHF